MPKKEANLSSLYKCMHGADSPCMAVCPFDFDIRKFTEKHKIGGISGAFNLYRDAVIFPGLVYQLCPAPCRKVCAAHLNNQGVIIPALEKAAYDKARSRDPVNYNAARQNKTAAVVGADLKGVACALRLAQNGFDVVVCERKGHICESIEKYLPREIFEPAIIDQFKYVKCSFIMNADLANFSSDDYDVVIVTNDEDLKFDGKNVFRLPGSSQLVFDIQIGKLFARQIEWYLKTGKLPSYDEIEALVNRATEINTTDNPLLDVNSAENLCEVSAKEIAAGCTGCDCSACLNECVMLRAYGSTVTDLARSVGLSLNLLEHAETREGMRQIGGCNFCGLCEKICPQGINVGEVLLEARTELFSKGVIPPAHHEFWLRDMAFADSESAAFFYQPNEASGKYMFFPGCQAGGSDPRYVSMTYDKLLKTYPDTSLLLYCCAAPLLWAGDEESMLDEHKKILEYWRKAGCPEVITVCPSCYKIFKTYLSQIPVIMLYEMKDMEYNSEKMPFATAAVFDPCASRDFPLLQKSVRNIVEKSGIKLEELKYHGEKSQCCSWGGHTYAVNRQVADAQVEEQVQMSELPYITYCTNCCDIFLSKGKECRHVLDMINGINQNGKKCPSLQQRRENRKALKRELIKRFCPGDELPCEEHLPELQIDEAILTKLNRELILTEDVAAVIGAAEKEGVFLIIDGTNHRIAHLRRGIITFWAEYIKNNNGTFTVVNAYSHRMRLKDE